jgi:hypothetical protein
MRRIVALAAIIFAIVMFTNGSAFAGASQPVATGITDHDTAQGLAALVPLRPVPSYSVPQASKPIPIACNGRRAFQCPISAAQIIVGQVERHGRDVVSELLEKPLVGAGGV